MQTMRQVMRKINPTSEILKEGVSEHFDNQSIENYENHNNSK